MAIKVAVIGMGGIGNTHAQCYVDNPLAELVAVCDMLGKCAFKPVPLIRVYIKRLHDFQMFPYFIKIVFRFI